MAGPEYDANVQQAIKAVRAIMELKEPKAGQSAFSKLLGCSQRLIASQGTANPLACPQSTLPEENTIRANIATKGNAQEYRYITGQFAKYSCCFPP